MASSCAPTVAEYQALVESLRDIAKKDAQLIDDRARLLDALTKLTERNEMLVEEQRKMKKQHGEDQRQQSSLVAALEKQNDFLRQQVIDRDDEISGLKKELTELKSQLSDAAGSTVKGSESCPGPRAQMNEQEKIEIDQKLIDAVRDSKLDGVRTLLANGANVDAVNEIGWTALMVAAVNRHLQIVEVLLANGADVHYAAKNGWTALMCAVQEGQLQIMEVLFVNGANVNHATENGSTALMKAASLGQSDVLEALIRRGAILDLRNKKGKTALKMTICKETAEMLKRAGACE